MVRLSWTYSTRLVLVRGHIACFFQSVHVQLSKLIRQINKRINKETKKEINLQVNTYKQHCTPNRNIQNIQLVNIQHTVHNKLRVACTCHFLFRLHHTHMQVIWCGGHPRTHSPTNNGPLVALYAYCTHAYYTPSPHNARNKVRKGDMVFKSRQLNKQINEEIQTKRNTPTHMQTTQFQQTGTSSPHNRSCLLLRWRWWCWWLSWTWQWSWSR